MSCGAVSTHLKCLIPSKTFFIINVSKNAPLDKILHVSI